MIKYPFLLLLTLLISCETTETIKIQGASGGQGQSFNSFVPRYWYSSDLNMQVMVSDSMDALLTNGDYIGDDSIYEQMMIKWEDSTPGITLFDIADHTTINKDTGNLSSYYDDEIGIYRSDSWFNDISSDALAITQYYVYKKNIGQSDEHQQITHADIIVNFKDHEFTLVESEEDRYDLPTVILHELGHLIGMKHQSNWMISAIMNPSLGLSEDKRSVYSDDQNRVQELYPASGFAPSFAKASALSSNDTTQEEDKTLYRGIIELRKSGECIHHFDGNVINTHFIFL